MSNNATSNTSTQGYAFFDLDYTLLPHDTMLLFCNYVLRKHPLRIFYVLIFLPIAPLAVLRLIRSRLIKRVFMSFLWRMPGERVLELAREFVEVDVLPRIYPELKQAVARHKEMNDFTILNTASPDFYVEPISLALGFDAFCATRVEIVESMPLFPIIQGKNNKNYVKLQTMREHLPKQVQDTIPPLDADELTPWTGDPDVRVPNSVAYSDSSADLPMLRLAERAILVHPTSRKLLREKAENKWTVLRPERPYRRDASRYWYALLQALGLYKTRGISPV